MLSAYEQQRADNIKANDAVLASLGIEPLRRPKITRPPPTKVAKAPATAERHQPSRGPQKAMVDQFGVLLDVATKGLQEATSQNEIDQHKEWIGSINECMTDGPQLDSSDEQWQEFLQNIRDGITSPRYSPTGDEDSTFSVDTKDVAGTKDVAETKDVTGTKDMAYYKRPRGRGRKNQAWSTETGKWEEDELA